VRVKLTVVLEPSDEGGFTALVPALPGCMSEGESRDEAIARLREAIALHLELLEDDRAAWPDAEIVEIAI
jgi:predicted RNase H-like HicB family nuclease